MKKLIYFLGTLMLLISMFNTTTSYWNDDDRREDMIVGKKDNFFFELLWIDENKWLSVWKDGKDISLKDDLLRVIQKYILWIVAILAIWMFIYIWYTLATAEWKEDQFKKWIKALVYLIVWLTVIPLSYIVIKIATWFSI